MILMCLYGCSAESRQMDRLHLNVVRCDKRRTEHAKLHNACVRVICRVFVIPRHEVSSIAAGGRLAPHWPVRGKGRFTLWQSSAVRACLHSLLGLAQSPSTGLQTCLHPIKACAAPMFLLSFPSTIAVCSGRDPHLLGGKRVSRDSDQLSIRMVW